MADDMKVTPDLMGEINKVMGGRSPASAPARGPAGKEIIQTSKGLSIRDNPRTPKGQIDISFAKTYDARTNAISDMLDKKVKEQNQAITHTIGDMMAMRASVMENTSPSLDLSSLASLVDARTGSQFAKKYVPPKQHKENMALAQKLTQGINQGREQISANERAVAEMKLKNRIDLEKSVADRELKAAIAHQMYGIKRRAMDKAPAKLVEKAAEYAAVINKADRVRDLVHRYRGVFGIASDSEFLNRMQSYAPGKKFSSAAKARIFIKGKLVELVSNIAKEQQGGRMSDKDIEMYKLTVGSLMDHPDTVIERINDLAHQAEVNRNGLIESYEMGGHSVGELRSYKRKSAPKAKQKTFKSWGDMTLEEKRQMQQRVKSVRGR